jgi:hydroxyethylthiazole kinase-like uncharacterized protein yjeF
VIKAYSAAQIRAAEAPHLAGGEPLMTRAAAGLAAEIRGLGGHRILLLVGSGNNGADTLWAGAELAGSGLDVALVPTSDHPNQPALDAALAAGARLRSPTLAASLAESVDVIVDGILGIGTNASPALRGTSREVVAAIQRSASQAKIVAVDIPSGINPDDGSVPDPTVLSADLTVTFGGYKAGLFLAPASAFTGEVRLIDVGLSADLEAMTPTLTIQ